MREGIALIGARRQRQDQVFLGNRRRFDDQDIASLGLLLLLFHSTQL